MYIVLITLKYFFNVLKCFSVTGTSTVEFYTISSEKPGVANFGCEFFVSSYF